MIYGMTDQPDFVRNGKIRAGAKDDRGIPRNSPHFLLHEVPELIPILGNTPDEIYFTVLAHNINYSFRSNLAWYTKSELVCRSYHGHKDPVTGENMGAVAAFTKVGVEVQGLSQKPFPGVQRSRIRNCAGKACPDYIRGDCGPHMLLDMVIPQYSMTNIFTFDSTSVIALKHVWGAFCSSFVGVRGKFAGQIYKLYKTKSDVGFQNKDGSMSKRETDVVHMIYVPIEEYEAKFRATIRPDNWEILMDIRNGRLAPEFSGLLIGAPADAAVDLVPQLEAAKTDATSTSPQPMTPASEAPAQSDADAIKQRANDPAVAPFFAEIALLKGKENSEEARISTAAAFPDVQSLVTYLKNRIKESKKAVKDVKAAPKAAVTHQAPPPTPAPAQAGAAATGPLF